MRLKVQPMFPAAQRAVSRAKGTTSGTFIWVGWSSRSQSITAGDKVMRSLPHIRVDVGPGDSPDDVEVKLALAVAKLRQKLPEALKRWRPPAPPGGGRNHAWGRKGSVRGRS